jgi:ABC-2 type transport system permease protein
MKRILGYEWVRATTIKSSFGFPLAGALLAWGVTFLFVRDPAEGSVTTFSDLAAAVFSPLSALLVTVPFAQAFGQDYRDGTMRLTLSEFPDRTKVFLAKLAVPALFAALGAALAIAGSALISLIGPVVDYGAIPGMMLRAAGYSILWGLMVAAVTIFTRNMAAGIAGVLVWGLILENILGSFLPEGVSRFLPISRGTQWFQSGEWEGFGVMALISVLLIGGAYWKFTRTDA